MTTEEQRPRIQIGKVYVDERAPSEPFMVVGIWLIGWQAKVIYKDAKSYTLSNRALNAELARGSLVEV